MKKYNMILSLLMLCLLSCSDKVYDLEPENDNNENEVLFSIDIEAVPILAKTRGFFDDTAETKPWEIDLKTLFLSIHVENEVHNLIKKYTFTKSEITSGKILVGVPQSYIGREIRFFAYANYVQAPGFEIAHSIFTTRSGSNLTYFGTYNDLSTGRKPISGFEMAGTILTTIPTADEVVPITIHLERLVNKVAIRTSVSDDFKNRYNGGDIKVLNTKINNIPNVSYLLRNDNMLGGTTVTNQDAVYENGYYNNLFYLFESDNLLEITLECVYDKTGKFILSTDQEKITYKFHTTIRGDNSNRRNDYHRLSITLKTLPNNISPDFTVDENWSNIVDNELEYDDFINFIDN